MERSSWTEDDDTNTSMEIVSYCYPTSNTLDAKDLTYTNTKTSESESQILTEGEEKTMPIKDGKRGMEVKTPEPQKKELRRGDREDHIRAIR